VESLKLTSYSGERRRAGRDLAGNALLDLYATAQIAASIQLRGTQGFGLRQQLGTDRSLTLPVDLPLVTVAVDTGPRIEAVLEQTLAITIPGLVTLEPVCLLDGDDSLARLGPGAPGPAGPPGPPGPPGDEVRLTVHLSRHEQAYQIPAYEAICDLLYRRCVAGATALLGVDGTARGRRQRARFLSRQAGAPMMVIAVGSRDQMMSVLPDVSGLLRDPLLTLEPVRVCKRDGLVLSLPGQPPAAGDRGTARWQKLTVYTSEAARHDGQPIHRVLARRLLAAGLGGVTTLRGVWGFHGEHAPHGGSALHLGHHVPAVTTVLDTPERIPAAFAIVDELTAERGLVTSETVPVLRAPAAGQTV
jgi:PII-like signaling protein